MGIPGHSHHASAFTYIHLELMQFLLEGRLEGQTLCTLAHPQLTVSSLHSYHRPHTESHIYMFTRSHTHIHTGSHISTYSQAPTQAHIHSHMLTHISTHACIFACSQMCPLIHEHTLKCTEATICKRPVHSHVSTCTAATHRLSHKHGPRCRHTTVFSRLCKTDISAPGHSTPALLQVTPPGLGSSMETKSRLALCSMGNTPQVRLSRAPTPEGSLPLTPLSSLPWPDSCELHSNLP